MIEVQGEQEVEKVWIPEQINAEGAREGTHAQGSSPDLADG